MRNLIYPLNWDDIFQYVGLRAFLKARIQAGMEACL